MTLAARDAQDAGDARDATQPYLRDELDARSLHFSMSAIQSRMHIARPDALALEYTRTMMGWLMFVPAAERLGVIGLGGGSLVKFCHRHLPRCRIVAVEIDPRVIAMRAAFQIPADDTRLRVVAGDGAQFVAQTDERFDVLMLDAFDADGMPAALGTQRFYDDCFDVLRPGGMLVANLHAGHPSHALHVDRIRRSFGQQVLRVDDRDGSNSVAFAARGDALAHAGMGTLHRPPVLADAPWNELRGAFSRVANALRPSQAGG